VIISSLPSIGNAFPPNLIGGENYFMNQFFHCIF